MFQFSTNDSLDEYTLKNYYYPSDEAVNIKTKRGFKRTGNDIETFFEKTNKKKTKSVSSCIGRRNGAGISYISTNQDDGSKATHLIKIEVFQMKKLKDVLPADYWKHCDLRVKYYAQSENDKNYNNTSDIIYSITKQIAEQPECKKFFIETDK